MYSFEEVLLRSKVEYIPKGHNVSATNFSMKFILPSRIVIMGFYGGIFQRSRTIPGSGFPAEAGHEFASTLYLNTIIFLN